MNNTANKLIEIAEKEVGYLEKETNKDLDSKSKNAGDENYTKYGQWIGLNGQFWCASFVCWCFNQAFGKEGKDLLCGAYSGACETIRANFVKKDKYFKRGAKRPKIGDVIFFTGTRHNGANHIGIVYKVDDTMVYTIEGNTSGGSNVIDNGGGVAKKKYALGYDKIMGYGRPSYNDEKTTKEADSTTKTKYYPEYKGSSSSIIDALASVGVKDTSLKHRVSIAKANGISNYNGTAKQNQTMIQLLSKGKLVKD